MQYNPLLPEVQQNPYPYYAYMRDHTPVCEVKAVGMWAVTRYEDVLFVLRNYQLFSSSALIAALLGEFNPVPEVPCIITLDPPEHGRIRKLTNRAFTPRIIAGMETRVRQIAKQLVSQAIAKGEFDFVKEISGPLPVIALASILGVEPELQQDFKRWADDIIVGGSSRAADDATRQRIHQSIAEFRTYLIDAIAQRRKTRREDLISNLVEAEEGNQKLTPDEVLSLALFLILGGSETTTNLLGNTMLALFNHPDQLAKIQADPALVPNALEEVLRYDAPVHMLFRRATQNVELAGTVIPEGAIVLTMYASANRDERKFPDPDRFDVTRNTEGHLGFSGGPHLCVGAPLARLEARAGLEEMLPLFPCLSRQSETVDHLEVFVVRGPKTLPLRYNAA